MFLMRGPVGVPIKGLPGATVQAPPQIAPSHQGHHRFGQRKETTNCPAKGGHHQP